MYEAITKPYVSPTCYKLKRRLDGWASVLLTMVNTGYLWIAWLCFVRLPEESRRFLVVALGTVYPVIASTGKILASVGAGVCLFV